MKKVLAMLLVLMMAVSLVACGGEAVDTGDEWAYGDYMTEEEYDHLTTAYENLYNTEVEFETVSDTLTAAGATIDRMEDIIASNQNVLVTVAGILEDPSTLDVDTMSCSELIAAVEAQTDVTAVNVDNLKALLG